MQFSLEEKERYKRHFSLPQVGIEGQSKLKLARVLIVGAGGLGSPIALYLAAAGVGRLTIIDHDTVSLSNLQRQILFSNNDVGSSKAEKAKERLENLNPDIEIRTIGEAFSESNGAELVRAHDFVIDGTDNFETRYLVNDLCVQENKPFVFGAISRFDAQVSVFHYEDGPCYRCLYPQAPPLEAVSNCNETGVLGVLPGTIGTLMATEALKMILQIGEIATGKLLIYDSLRSEIYKRKLLKNNDCPGCGSGAFQAINRAKLKSLTMSEITNIEDFFVIDVRQENEFQEKHLPTAHHFALPELKTRVGQIPRGQNLLLVCKSGKRSSRAYEILESFGYENLFQLEGGMDQYDQN